MPTAPNSSSNFAAAHCHAKDPATCRVHGHAAVRLSEGADAYLGRRTATVDLMSPMGLQGLLRGEFAGVLSQLETAVAKSFPVYISEGGLGARLASFDERIERAAADLITLVQQAKLAGKPVDGEMMRSELSHNLFPVIGWIEADVYNRFPNYGTSALREKIQAVSQQLLAYCQPLAERFNNA